MTPPQTAGGRTQGGCQTDVRDCQSSYPWRPHTGPNKRSKMVRANRCVPLCGIAHKKTRTLKIRAFVRNGGFTDFSTISLELSVQRSDGAGPFPSDWKKDPFPKGTTEIRRTGIGWVRSDLHDREHDRKNSRPVWGAQNLVLQAGRWRIHH